MQTRKAKSIFSSVTTSNLKLSRAMKTVLISPIIARFSLPLVVFAGLLTSGCMRTTGPTEVGVLVRKASIIGNRGVDNEVLAPGSTYFLMPIVSEFYTFETRTQNLEMTKDANRGDRNYDDQLNFKTIDGNDIGLDVIVSYRIIPEKAPQLLGTVARNDAELKNNVVRSVARSIARDVFGELRTEEFYIAAEREKKSEQAKAALDAVLGKFGVKVEAVSTKDYRFNSDYQKAIEDRKIADQRAEKYKSETHAAYEEYQKKLEQAKGEVNQMTAKADGEFRRAQLEANAYFDQQSKRAEAIRAEGEAESKGISEMNKALSESGGEVMVKLKLAEALIGKQIVVLPQGANGVGFQTTNMNQMLSSLGLLTAATDPVKALAPQGNYSQGAAPQSMR